jgi:hypothetical protein
MNAWEDTMTRFLLAAAAGALIAGPAFADATCKQQATDKKLAGAALTSFLKKCETDATTACQKQSADKKLAGAAKTSFEKKCVGDATGTAAAPAAAPPAAAAPAAPAPKK